MTRPPRLVPRVLFSWKHLTGSAGPRPSKQLTVSCRSRANRNHSRARTEPGPTKLRGPSGQNQSVRPYLFEMLYRVPAGVPGPGSHWSFGEKFLETTERLTGAGRKTRAGRDEEGMKNADRLLRLKHLTRGDVQRLRAPAHLCGSTVQTPTGEEWSTSTQKCDTFEKLWNSVELC